MTRLATSGEAVDAAKFVSGGAVLFLFGDGSEVGDVIGGGHGDGAHPETGERGVVVEEGAVFGVGVEEVKGPWNVKEIESSTRWRRKRRRRGSSKG